MSEKDIRNIPSRRLAALLDFALRDDHADTDQALDPADAGACPPGEPPKPEPPSREKPPSPPPEAAS